MKLLIDANLSTDWKKWLAAHDIAATHWFEVGISDAPDSEIMSYAAANDLIVLTRDLDFGHMLQERNARLPSVVQLRGLHVPPESFGQLLIDSLRQSADQLSEGAILTVTANRRARLTVLPFRR